MKIKSFIFLVIILLLVFSAASCIIINAPASDSASSQPANAGSPAATTTLIPAATATASSTLGTPPTAPPTPTPLSPLTVIDQPTRYANGHISVDIHCPEISGMQDNAMQGGINTGVNDYLTTHAATLEQQSIQDEANFGAHTPYVYESSFSVMRNDGQLLSVLISIQTYEGGAHTASEYATINAVNSDPGDQWMLSDLFIPGSDYVTEINNEINAIIVADASMNGAFWFTTISANQTFYLTDNELVLVFEPYSIAPGAYGAPMFEIPFGNLPSLSAF